MQKKIINCMEILQQLRLFWLFAFKFNINCASSDANMRCGSREPLAASSGTTYNSINLLPRLEERVVTGLTFYKGIILKVFSSYELRTSTRKCNRYMGRLSIYMPV